MAVLRRFSRLWGFLIFLLALLAFFRHIVVPFIFAIIVAYMLAPTVRRLQPSVGRGGAIAICYLVIFSAIGLFIGFGAPALVRELATLRQSGPELVAKFNTDVVPRVSTWFEENLGSFMEPQSDPSVDDGPPPDSELRVTPMPDGTLVVQLEGVQLDVHETGDGGWTINAPGHQQPKKKFDLGATLRRMAAERAREFTSQLGEIIQALVTGLVTFATNFVITFMVAAFILGDLERIQRFMRSLIAIDYQHDFDEILRGVDLGMSGVIRGQLMICAVNGALTYIGLLIFQVKYSLLLGLLAGAFSLVPIFGTIISSVPILLFAVLSGPDGSLALSKGLAMLAWIAGIHLVEANFLNPKIIGGSAHIHPVVVVFALLAGEEIYGLTGALLAVPAASMVQTIFLYARRRSQKLIERVRADEARESMVGEGRGRGSLDEEPRSARMNRDGRDDRDDADDAGRSMLGEFDDDESGTWVMAPDDSQPNTIIERDSVTGSTPAARGDAANATSERASQPQRDGDKSDL